MCLQVESLNVEPRAKLALKLISPLAGKIERMIDLGCNDGGLTLLFKEKLSVKEVYGVDINEEAVLKAGKRGVKAYRLDLSKDKLPFPDNFFDLVVSFEVIEHLINPDNMLREARRVLKRGGFLLISTPNLASWINRIILLFGYQPYNVEVSTEITAGIPYKKGVFGKPSGHIRAFTLRALRELLEYHGFRIIKIIGTHGVNPKNTVFMLLDRFFSLRPALTRRLIVSSYEALKP